MGTANVKPDEAISARHQIKGGTYLVVVDKTGEFLNALQYAGKMAKANQCHVGILRVMEDADFQHWGNVEKRIQNEQREEAERMLGEASLRLQDFGGDIPSIYIEQGPRMECLSRTIDNDPNITMLILGGGTGSSGPGPLVSHFTGKGMGKLRVPVMIVPDHIQS